MQQAIQNQKLKISQILKLTISFKICNKYKYLKSLKFQRKDKQFHKAILTKDKLKISILIKTKYKHYKFNPKTNNNLKTKKCNIHKLIT